MTPEVASAVCLCGHSGSAHRRGNAHACGFCECDGFSTDPYVIDHSGPKETDEVAMALEALGQNQAFAGVAGSHLAALGKHGNKRLFMAGSILMDKGDSSERLYLLLKGRVQVQRPAAGALPELLAELAPGDIVGEVGLLHGVRHSATVTALEDLRVLEISSEDLHTVFHESHALLLAFLRMIHHRLQIPPASD